MKLKMVVASVTGVVALLGGAAGPAFADCINVSRSDKANVRIAANSPTTHTACPAPGCSPFATLDAGLLFLFQQPSSVTGVGLSLCPQGAQYLVDQIDAAAALPDSGIDLNWVFSFEVLQAGGVLSSPNPRAQTNLSNGTGIDFVGTNAAILAVIDANIATAQGICGP